MADVDRTVDVLRGLRAIGVRTALDDFGAGHAALGQLKHLEVDTLKIDCAFVMRVAQDERDAAIVQSLVDLGRRLGLRVVAEGVETREAGPARPLGVRRGPGSAWWRRRCRRPSWWRAQRAGRAGRAGRAEKTSLVRRVILLEQQLAPDGPRRSGGSRRPRRR